MCFVFWVCFKQKPWLILREQKRNVILHLQSKNYQTWIQQCRVTTFVCVFLWVCVHIKVKIYKKMAEQAPAVFNVVCCGGVWKSQMSMQKQRAYSQSATGGTSKNHIRVCFGLFCCMCDSSKRYVGVYPEDSSLFLCGFFYWEMFLFLFPCENKVLRVQSGCHLGISATLSFCCLVAEGFYLS